MSYSKLIDQYENLLREILILRSSTQIQIKACAVVRDVKISHLVSGPSEADKPKKQHD